jgi:hypothetical protein
VLDAGAFHRTRTAQPNHGAVGATDPIDAHIVLLARERGWPVLSSDPADLLAIDPTLVVERI